MTKRKRPEADLQRAVKKKRSKFGNVRVKDDGISFDSKREHKRYLQLKLLEMAREISGLEIHKRYSLNAPGGAEVGYYEADFVYYPKDGRTVVEDCKGFRTDLYKWKKRHLKAQYNIDILET